MDTHTPPRNRSQKLGIGGLALLACIAVALCWLAFSPRTAHATETTVKVSNAQTEMYSTSVYLTDMNIGTPIIESVPSGWTKWTTSSAKQPSVRYSNGTYWKSGTATIKVRWDKIGKVNGQWVSLRLTVSNMKGDAACDIGSMYNISNAKAGSGIIFNVGELGFSVYGLRQCDAKIELFNYSTKANVSLKGGFCGFGSLDYLKGVAAEGVRYLTTANHKAYVLTTNCLTCTSDGTWKGSSYNAYCDSLGTKGYSKSAVSFGTVDATPSFRFTNEGTNNASYISISLSPLTAAIPPSPTKSATITG